MDSSTVGLNGTDRSREMARRFLENAQVALFYLVIQNTKPTEKMTVPNIQLLNNISPSFKKVLR